MRISDTTVSTRMNNSYPVFGCSLSAASALVSVTSCVIFDFWTMPSPTPFHHGGKHVRVRPPSDGLQTRGLKLRRQGCWPCDLEANVQDVATVPGDCERLATRPQQAQHGLVVVLDYGIQDLEVAHASRIEQLVQQQPPESGALIVILHQQCKLGAIASIAVEAA